MTMEANFYEAPSHMAGGYIVYGGYRRQRGGKLFGSFRNMITPIGRQLVSGIKTIAKNKAVRNIAKTVAQKGAEVAVGVAVDALQGRNVGESLKERTRQTALDTLTTALEEPRKRKLKQNTVQKQQARKPSYKRRRLSRAALNQKDLF